MSYATIHFLRFIFLAIVMLVSFLIFIPTNTYAYFTTNQETAVLPNHSALFQIDYQFGTKNHEINIPVLAHNRNTKENNALSYSIIDETGAEFGGKAIGIVFSNAELTKNGMYRIQKNTAKKFSLMVLFTPPSYDSTKQYRLQVTHLPFTFEDKGQQLQLNPSELQYYTSKLTSL